MAAKRKSEGMETSEILALLLADERVGVYRLIRDDKTTFSLYRIARDVVKICSIEVANSTAGDALPSIWNNLEHVGVLDVLHLEGGDIKLSS